MVKRVGINSVSHQKMRQAAQQLDNQQGVGNGDGNISGAEVDQAITSLKAQAPSAQRDELLTQAQSLKTYVAHYGSDAGGNGAPAANASNAPSMGMLGLLSANNNQPTQQAGNKDPIMLDNGQKVDSISTNFRATGADRDVKDGQSVLVPLEGRQLHLIELKYQDTRKLKDLEFNYREKGSGEWKTFRGDQYHSMVQREQAGEVDIKRESDHNSPWINNPVRVKVDVLMPDGSVHNVGKKFLDFHVHDAHGPNSSGYPETDNISNGYENLPAGKLPEGAMLRLTPMHENRKPWEADRTTAMEMSWVKPVYMPEHKEKVRIESAHSYSKPPSDGYAVDPNRPIAGVMVNWTDNGGMSSGRVSFGTENGQHRSSSYNVGSGETELIPVDNLRAKDGRIHVTGHGVEVRNIDVLYADEQ
jgi:hypothetical protein